MPEFCTRDRLPASGKTQVRGSRIVRPGQKAKIAIAECDQMFCKHKSGAEIINADQIELAAGREFQYIAVQQNNSNASLVQHVCDFYIDGFAIRNGFNGRKENALYFPLNILEAQC